MSIYLEDFLLQNIIINFCLIKLVLITTKPNSSFFKILCASIIGSLFSLIICLFISNTIIINLFKLLCSNLMILTAFKQTKKQHFFNLILLFIYTYALGGIITSFNPTTYYTPFGIIISCKFTLELICSLIIVFTYIFELITKHLKLKINLNNFIYNLTLKHKNKIIKINAYMDSGNLLNYNGQPVLILDLNTYLTLTKTNLIDFHLCNTNKITTKTIVGTNELKLFTIDKIKFKINKKNIELNNQLIAVNNTNCFKNTNYQALLSPLFL